MMTATALIFPIALFLALGTIASMLRGYGAKMMAALRMEPYAPQSAAPLPPAKATATLAYARHSPTPATLRLAA